MSGRVRQVYNRLLGGWFNVRGAHQTPLGGKFSSREEARAALDPVARIIAQQIAQQDRVAKAVQS